MADPQTKYTKINIGLIALPTFEYAVSKGEEYCSQLYADLGCISGYMDLADNGGTPEWWQISDLSQKLAEHLKLED